VRGEKKALFGGPVMAAETEEKHFPFFFLWNIQGLNVVFVGKGIRPMFREFLRE